MFSRIKNIQYWCSKDLDNILVHGNELYGLIRKINTKSQDFC